MRHEFTYKNIITTEVQYRRGSSYLDGKALGLRITYDDNDLPIYWVKIFKRVDKKIEVRYINNALLVDPMRFRQEFANLEVGL